MSPRVNVEPSVPSLPCEKSRSQSNSVRRALAILEFLKNSDRRRNLSEISRKLDLAKSTTSILLSTLETNGYIRRDSGDRRYSLSFKAFGFSPGLLNHSDLSRQSRTVLEAIAAALKLTSHVAVLDVDQALFINKADGSQQRSYDIYPGRRTNLRCTAVGKVLLAYETEEEQRRFLARHPFIRHTSTTIVSPEALMEELRCVRNQGYAYDDQEEELLVRCLAVPIFKGGRPFAALGITGTVSQIQPRNIEELVTYLKRMSSQILR